MATVKVNSVFKTKAANGDIQEHYLATNKAMIADAGQPNGVATLDTNGALVQMPTLAQVGGHSNNLLHNWDWRYAINPLGITTQTIEGNNIARWFAYSAGNNDFTLAIVNGQYIRIATRNHLVQQGSRLERLPNGIYTLSILLSNGTAYSTTITWDGNTLVGGDVVAGLGLFLAISLGYPYYHIIVGAGKTFEIVAVGLEPGMVSTLKNAPPPDPEQEESKCQRFYETITTWSIQAANNNAQFSVPFKVKKRIVPNIQIKSVNGIIGKMSYYDNAGWIDTDVTFTEATETHVLAQCQVPNTGVTIRCSVIADANL